MRKKYEQIIKIIESINIFNSMIQYIHIKLKGMKGKGEKWN